MRKRLMASSNERKYLKLTWRHFALWFGDNALKFFKPTSKLSQVLKMCLMTQTPWHFWFCWRIYHTTSKHRRILYNQSTRQNGDFIISCKKRTHATRDFLIVLTTELTWLSNVVVLLATTMMWKMSWLPFPSPFKQCEQIAQGNRLQRTNCLVCPILCALTGPSFENCWKMLRITI